MRCHVACLVGVIWLTGSVCPGRADVTFLGVGTLPGETADKSGLKGATADGTPNDRLGGQGSAIAYAGDGNRYVAAADSGPKDDADGFKCRFHVFEIKVTAGPKPSVQIELVSTSLLVNEDGKNFTGSAAAFDAKDPAKSLRLDPEGVRVGRNRNAFISDEYGPYLYEFTPAGKRVRSLKVPDKFLIEKPAKTGKGELPPANTKGRQPNKSMEGLAISPDGGKLYGLLQNPLLQDGALNTDNKRAGVNNRLLEVDVATGKTREFVYQLEDSAHSTCEITAVNDHEFLVLERDNKGGEAAKAKRLYKIDIAAATDVSAVAALPAGELPETIKPVKKALFLDVLDKKYGLAGKDMPEKLEGLTFGPDLPDGRRLLLISADNDFKADVPYRVYAFAVDAADLPGYQPQEFDPKPAR